MSLSDAINLVLSDGGRVSSPSVFKVRVIHIGSCALKQRGLRISPDLKRRTRVDGQRLRFKTRSHLSPPLARGRKWVGDEDSTSEMEPAPRRFFSPRD